MSDALPDSTGAPGDSGEMGADSDPRPARRSWGGILRTAFALLVLGAVLWAVPWSDRLIVVLPAAQEGAAAELRVPGTLVGDWRDDRVGFRPAEGLEPDPAWPAGLARAAREGGTFEAARGPGAASDPGGVALDWRPGMLRAFADLDLRGLLPALAFLFIGAFAAVTRWWRLLAVAGCPTTWPSAVRLTFLGLFFNQILPGVTGGDVVKAVLVVRRHPERRADALVTILVDRVIGLLVLVALGALVVLLSGERFAELRLPVALALAALLVGSFVLIHPLPRRLVRLEAILARLPQSRRLQKLDDALRLYARHPLELGLAVLLSLANHLALAGAVLFIGRAFGDRTLSAAEYVGVTAIANTVSAVPVAPGGWGVGEATFGYLFGLLGAVETLGVATSVTFRLLMTAVGLCGGLFLLAPGQRPQLAEIEREAEATAPDPAA